MQHRSKVLVISHSLIIRSYRSLYEQIAEDPKIDLTILTPLFWKESGKWVFFQSSKCKNNLRIFKEPPLFLWTNKPLLNLTLIYPRLFSLLIRENFDIVHVIEEPYSISAFITAMIIKLFRLRSKLICFSAQNLNKKLPFPFSLFEKIVIKKSFRLLPLTKDVSGILRKKGSKKTHNIIPLGFDDSLIRISESEVLNKKKKIAFIGRLEPFKGLDFFLSLAKKHKNKEFEFIVAGKGSLLNSVKNNPYIKYIGFIENYDIDKFYQSIDLLIVPSKTTDKVKEQFGRVVLEAIANNCPVLVSDSGELPNIVEDSIFIFKEKDISSLDNKFVNLINNLENDDLIKRFDELKKKIYSKYSYSSIAERLKKIYLKKPD